MGPAHRAASSGARPGGRGGDHPPRPSSRSSTRPGPSRRHAVRGAAARDRHPRSRPALGPDRARATPAVPRPAPDGSAPTPALLPRRRAGVAHSAPRVPRRLEPAPRESNAHPGADRRPRPTSRSSTPRGPSRRRAAPGAARPVPRPRSRPGPGLRRGRSTPATRLREPRASARTTPPSAQRRGSAHARSRDSTTIPAPRIRLRRAAHARRSVQTLPTVRRSATPRHRRARSRRDGSGTPTLCDGSTEPNPPEDALHAAEWPRGVLKPEGVRRIVERRGLARRLSSGSRRAAARAGAGSGRRRCRRTSSRMRTRCVGRCAP
jgi:hypothetical protein